MVNGPFTGSPKVEKMFLMMNWRSSAWAMAWRKRLSFSGFLRRFMFRKAIGCRNSQPAFDSVAPGTAASRAISKFSTSPARIASTLPLSKAMERPTASGTMWKYRLSMYGLPLSQ
ncbi:hypothetical protein D9M72_545450 [compost metagenome]